MTEQHAAGGESNDKGGSSIILSAAYIERLMPNEMYLQLGPWAGRTVLISLMGSFVLGSHPHQFDKATWIREVGYDAETFRPLKDEQAEAVLGIGVECGLLDHDPAADTYSIPDERLRSSMQALFVLATDPYMRWNEPR